MWQLYVEKLFPSDIIIPLRCRGIIIKFLNFQFAMIDVIVFWNLLEYHKCLAGFRTSYPWYIEPPAHDILIFLPMVNRAPYLCSIEIPTHGISNTLPMVWWTPYPWYDEPLTHGMMNPLPWYDEPPPMVLWGGSIYHDGVQNTMTQIWPQGQNTI